MINLKMHPAITMRVNAIEEAEDDLADTLAEIQASCPHHVLVEKPWDDIFNATRICLNCRLEEKGTHWSGGAVWSKEGFGDAELGNQEGRLVLTPTQAGLPADKSFWWFRPR